ncbi:MAG: hypothetical protein GC154_16115 [bacterium]|nr:hypothetical protein [bacterium]
MNGKNLIAISIAFCWLAAMTPSVSAQTAAQTAALTAPATGAASVNPATSAYAVGAGPDEILRQANQYYHDGRFDAALTGYMTLAEGGAENGHLFFNIANTEFMLGRLGEAILWYERAQRYLPRDEDVRTNLQYARNQLVDEGFKPPKQNGTLGALLWVYDSFNIRELLKMGLFALWVAAMLASAMILIRSEAIRRWLRIPCWVALFAFILFVSCACARIYVYETVVEAVIVQSAVEVRTAPVADASTAFSLHEGTTVRIQQQQNDWVFVRLPGDASLNGWMKRDSLRVI